jgi:3-hydroxyacyl-[acyl-carrier-protein] dehydratase
MTYPQLLQLLPYSKPFLFVDALHELSDESAEGSYTFKKDEFFYEGHFKDLPITPGVILTECMAQIGLVCLGIYLLHQQKPELLSVPENLQVAFTSSDVQFLKPVFPEEKVVVKSQRLFWRFGKLKCATEMLNAAGNVVAKGELAGMLKI